jgi:hypothetical protein
MQRFCKIKKIRKYWQQNNYMGGWGGLEYSDILGLFFSGFRVRGGGKCPEEEHTTCNGGPTINCHKRGLWGEALFYSIK